MKNRIAAENAVLYDGRQRRSNNDPCEHRLVKAANQFFERERDGGNGRIKCGGDARGHSH